MTLLPTEPRTPVAVVRGSVNVIELRSRPRSTGHRVFARFWTRTSRRRRSWPAGPDGDRRTRNTPASFTRKEPTSAVQTAGDTDEDVKLGSSTATLGSEREVVPEGPGERTAHELAHRVLVEQTAGDALADPLQ